MQLGHINYLGSDISAWFPFLSQGFFLKKQQKQNKKVQIQAYFTNR